MTTPVRFGLIGVGRWGKVYLRSLLTLGERCRISHLGTSKPANAQLVPYPVTVLADWRAVVRADCDAVIIATPPQTHAEILEACLEAGRPCIVEKPLCLDVATAERLHQRVQASRVPVLVDHTLLFSPAYQTLKRAVAASGELVRLMLSEGMALGPFRTDVSVLWDWCPHDVSLCVDLMGEMPVDVAAFGGPTDAKDSPELVSVRLGFAGGASAWIQAGRLSLHKRRNLSVLTDTQLYVFDELASEPLTATPFHWSRREASGDARVIPVTPARRPMEQMLTEFLDGLAGGDRRRFGTDLALEVVRVLARCDASLKPACRAQRGAGREDVSHPTTCLRPDGPRQGRREERSAFGG